MLFSMKPAAGTIEPQPSPLEAVSEAALPHADVGGTAPGRRVFGHHAAETLDGGRIEQPRGRLVVDPGIEPAGDPGLLRGSQGRRHAPGLVHAERIARHITAGEDLQSERDQQAAGCRRRVGEHAMAAIVDGERLAQFHAVALEVLAPKVSATRLAGRGDRARDLAAVEQVRPLDRHGVEKVAEFGHRVPVAGLLFASARREHVPRLGRRLEYGPDHLRDVGLQGLDLDAFPAGFHRRGHDVPRRHAAELRLEPEGTRDHARRRRGPEPDVELLLGGAEVGDDRAEIRVLRLQPRARCMREEIVDPRRLVRRPRQQEAATARRGQHRLGHARRPQGRRHRVERVAAGLQHGDRRIPRHRMPAGHCTSRDTHRIVPAAWLIASIG